MEKIKIDIIEEKEELKNLILVILIVKENIVDFVLLKEIRKVKRITMLELVKTIEEMKMEGLLYQPRFDIIKILK